MISAIVLAGGKSTRMGKDKAFLEYDPSCFIDRISKEMLKLTNDLIVVIGKKDRLQFELVFGSLGSSLAGNAFRILNDKYELDNPLGGMLTGFEVARNQHASVVACDMPLVNHNVIGFLYNLGSGYECAVPMWENCDIEPLCAVYDARRSLEAGLSAVKDGKIGPKHLVSYLQKVNYVPVSQLRNLDPELRSLLNINSPKEYEDLLLSLSIRRKPPAVGPNP
jgi:molybdopterin-guanine dinucleotide biosynthesis protein A